jgi:hypothetical protein
VVTAEALVWRHGSRAVEMARHAAESPHQAEEDRRHWQAVVRITKRRLAKLDGADTATRYEAGNRWSQRRGSFVGTVLACGNKVVRRIFFLAPRHHLKCAVWQGPL